MNETDQENVEIEWSAEDLPKAIKADSQGVDFVEIDQVTHNEFIRVQRQDGSWVHVVRIEFVMANDKLGELYRSGSRPDWQFTEKGLAPSRRGPG